MYGKTRAFRKHARIERPPSGAWIAIFVGTIGLCLSGTSLGSPGTSVPLRLAFGLGRHPAPTMNLNPARDGTTPLRLPKRLAVIWRGHVPGGIFGAAIAEGGSVIVGTPDATLLELDADGDERWRRKLRGRVASNVAVLANGTRVVATRGGWLHGFDAEGAEGFISAPGFKHPDDIARILPLPDGSLVCASMRELAWLESDGSRRAETEIDESILDIAYASGNVIAFGRTGHVYVWNGDEAARALGDFGGALRALPLVHDGTLLAMNQDSLRQKHLETGNVRNWVGSVGQDGNTALAIGRAGEVVWLDRENALSRASRSSGVQKTPLGPQTTQSSILLAPISDGKGNVILLNALGELVRVDADDTVTAGADIRCTRPVGILPQGPGRMVLVCGTGSIWGLGD